MNASELTFRELIASVIPRSAKIAEMPMRVSDKTIDALCEEGIVVKGKTDVLFSQLRTVALTKGQILQLPEEYVMPREEVNYIIKGMRGMSVINLNSSFIVEAVVEQLAQNKSKLPESYRKADYKRMTAEVAELIKLYPYYMIKEGVEQLKGADVAPIAYAWYGSDAELRAVTWTRLIEGAELFAASLRKEHEIGFPDKKFYGRNIRVCVESLGKDEEGSHTFTLTGLPIFTEYDSRQHHQWRDLKGSCNCTDKSFTSELHDKRARKTNIYCKHEIGAFFAAMRYLSTLKRQYPNEHKGHHFRVNPFGIPTERLAKLAEVLRTKTFIEKRMPNKTEISRVMGRYAVENGYDNAFYHWGRLDPRGRPRQLENYL